MQTGTVASDSVTKLLERLAYQVNHTVHTADVEAVHDLRVAIRRFAQSLYLFKSAFAAKEVRKVRRRLKELMEATNEVRDCDVAMNLMDQREFAGLPALQQAIRTRRKEAACPQGTQIGVLYTGGPDCGVGETAWTAPSVRCATSSACIHCCEY